MLPRHFCMKNGGGHATVMQIRELGVVSWPVFSDCFRLGRSGSRWAPAHQIGQFSKSSKLQD